MRVTTAFNRLLALPGARVIDVSFTAEEVVVEVALRRRRALAAARSVGRSTTAAGAPSTSQASAFTSSTACAACAAPTASRRCPSQGLVPATPATSRTSRPSSPSRWPRRRSQRYLGSAGTRWARSPGASSATTSTSEGSPGSSRSASTRSLPPRPALLDERLRSPLGGDRVDAPGPKRRHPAGLLPRARRAPPLDPRGLDRHVGRLRQGGQGGIARCRGLHRPLPRLPARRPCGRRGPPLRVEREGQV